MTRITDSNRAESLKQLTIGDKKILAVRIAYRAYNMGVTNDNRIRYDQDIEDDKSNCYFIDLPPGNWQIISRANEITYQQAKEVVEFQDMPDEFLGTVTWYRKYPDEMHESCLMNALDSWQSFCRANNMTNHLILIQLP